MAQCRRLPFSFAGRKSDTTLKNDEEISGFLSRQGSGHGDAFGLLPLFLYSFLGMTLFSASH